MAASAATLGTVPPSLETTQPPGPQGKARRPWRWAAAGVVVLLLAVGGWLGIKDPWNWLHRADDSVELDWQQAQAAIADRNFDLAEQHLRHCLEAWPFNAETNFLMARTLRREGDYEQWTKYLSRADYLGWPEEQLQLERKLKEAQRGNIWRIEAELLDLLDDPPAEEPLIYEALAQGYLANERLDGVYRLTTTWIQRYPNDWLPVLYRGRAAQLHGLGEKAIEDYQQVLSVRPDQESAHLWLGETLMADTQLQEALDQFETYIARHPNDPDVLVAAANCQFNLSRNEEARKTVEHLLAVEPNDKGGLSLKAKLDLSRGRPKEALQSLERARALGSRDMDVINNLAIAHRQLGHSKEADKYQKQFNELMKKNREWAELTKKIKQHPEDVDLRYEAGLVCLARGSDQEAAHWFQTALYIDPRHRPTQLALADYWRQHGDPQRAAYYQRRAEGKTN